LSKSTAVIAKETRPLGVQKVDCVYVYFGQTMNNISSLYNRKRGSKLFRSHFNCIWM